MNELIINYNLSVLFTFSILSIILIGVIVFELVKTKNPEVKKLQRSFICLLVLLEMTFIFSASSYIFKCLDYLTINLIAALCTLFFYLIIILRFWRFLDKKFVFLNLFFGAVSIIGIVESLFFGNIFSYILRFAGVVGLTIFAPLLIMKFLIDTSKEKMNNKRK